MLPKVLTRIIGRIILYIYLIAQFFFVQAIRTWAQSFIYEINTIPLTGETAGFLGTSILQYGVYFWEVDYVGVSFDGKGDAVTRITSLESAVDGGHSDVKDLLVADDHLYYVQREAGLYADLCFSAPPASEGMDRSVFLHSKGH